MRIKVKELKANKDRVGQEVVVKGWVRTVRGQKNVTIIKINDESTLSNLQIIDDQTLSNYETTIINLTTGCSISIKGKLAESPGAKQAVEIHAHEINVIGLCDADSYPLQKKRHSFEFLRSIA